MLGGVPPSSHPPQVHGRCSEAGETKSQDSLLAQARPAPEGPDSSFPLGRVGRAKQACNVCTYDRIDNLKTGCVGGCVTLGCLISIELSYFCRQGDWGYGDHAGISLLCCE